MRSDTFRIGWGGGGWGGGGVGGWGGGGVGGWGGGGVGGWGGGGVGGLGGLGGDDDDIVTQTPRTMSPEEPSYSVFTVL